MRENFSLICIIIIIIIFIFGIYIDFSTKKVDINLNGVKYKLEEENYQELVKIRIEGNYYNKFYTNRKFEGKIYIDEYVLYSLILKFDKNNCSSLISSSPWLNIGGKIVINKDFTKLTICFTESVLGDWMIEDNLILSAPATNLDEALKISKELLNDLNYE